MTDKTTAERLAFEAWLPKSWSRATITDDDGDESYEDDWVQGAWVGFREARASLPPPGAQEAVTTLALRMLVAADHITQEKADEAISLASRFAAPQPALSAGWQPIETAPKYTEHGVTKRLLLGYAPDETHEDGFVSQGYWMEAEEDAPDNMGHDGGWVDVHFDFFSCGRSFGAEVYRSAGTQPTHWQPLPPSPSMDGESNG